MLRCYAFDLGGSVGETLNAAWDAAAAKAKALALRRGEEKRLRKLAKAVVQSACRRRCHP